LSLDNDWIRKAVTAASLNDLYQVAIDIEDREKRRCEGDLKNRRSKERKLGNPFTRHYSRILEFLPHIVYANISYSRTLPNPVLEYDKGTVKDAEIQRISEKQTEVATLFLRLIHRDLRTFLKAVDRIIAAGARIYRTRWSFLVAWSQRCRACGGHRTNERFERRRTGWTERNGERQR